ncbi:metallophosphoesterase, partial [Clostridium sporogenes]
MKLFFISDIHGSAYYLEKVLHIFEEEKADYLIILGDEL